MTTPFRVAVLTLAVACLCPGAMASAQTNRTSQEGVPYVSGGVGDEEIAAMRAMDAAIAADERRGITACWHDESHWNRYLIDHEPAIELSPDYMCPPLWRPETQRIVIVEKDNQEVRS